jgi:RHS repeat-associated protein
MTSGFTPGVAPMEVTLDHAERISAIKVYGPAPYRLDVRGHAGASLGFETMDLSTLAPGWHAFASNALVSTSVAELHFDTVGTPGAIPELELWAVTDGAPPKLDIGAPELANGLVGFEATSKSEDILPGNCASFQVAMARSPSQLRRAHLVYGAQGLFRPWAIMRSINGLAEPGGAWVAGDSSLQTIVDEIDPSELHVGDNEVSLCLPNMATRPVAITNLRLVGELDRGVRLATAVSIGTDLRDASDLLEIDPATPVDVGTGERIVVGLDRLIAPDVLVVSGHVGPAATIECVDKRGGAKAMVVQPHATSTGVVFAVDGQARACAELAITLGASATLTGLDVVGSGAGEPVDWPRIVVTSAPEHFGDTAWLGGFIARPPVMTGAIRVELAGSPVDALTGRFGRLVERAQELASPWPIAVTAHLPDGTIQTRQVVLSEDHRAQRVQPAGAASGASGASAPSSRFGNAGESIVVRASASAPSSIRLGSHVGVDVPAGAVAHPTDVTLRHLDEHGLPPLDPGMINVTAPKNHGFEFLPHGQRFAKPVEVVVPYDPSLIPEDMTPEDVHTYFYDPAAERWQVLDRKAIDVAEHLTRSTTHHFTIMIDAVLAVPKNPAPLSFDPTALTSIGAASPAANIDLIEPPQANSTGDARMSLPIRVPKGRGTYTPSLGVGYSSASGNGWLGVGWDLAVSRIEIDTRWGVPTYAPTEEPRYLLDGAELVPTIETEGPHCQSGIGRRYHTRVEGGFAHILRCEVAPGSPDHAFHWEVHDRDGTLFYYGDEAETDPAHATLADPDDPHKIFRWGLRRVVDVHGNGTSFEYQHVGITGRDMYPASIEYTSHPSNPSAPYSIELVLDDGARSDRIITGRPGFKVVTQNLLRSVRVRFHSQIIRQYVLTYTHGQFEKSLLASIKVYGLGGCATSVDAFVPPTCPGALDEHTFDYYREGEGFAVPIQWQVDGDPDPSTAALTKGRTGTFSGHISFGVGDETSIGAEGSLADRLEHVGLHDMNGDGLPDEVFADGTVLYNQARTALDPSTPLFTREGPTVIGLPSLGRESHDSWGISGTVAGVGGGFQDSTARAEQFLTDLNGDGFLDLVVGRGHGESWLGRPCAGQSMCFGTTPFGATAGVDPHADPLLNEIGDAVVARLFVGDPVVQWIAPFEGRVTVTGAAHKASAGGTDGVAIELYHQDALLDANTVGPDDVATFGFPSAPITLDVNAGEAIYVRVKTGNDEAIDKDGTLHDLVDARLTVRYEHACTDAGCAAVPDPLGPKEPMGSSVFAFDSAEDFRIAGTPAPFIAPVTGIVDVRGLLVKRPAVADLRACVQRFPSPAEPGFVPSLDVPCDATGTAATNMSGTFALPSASALPQPISIAFPVDAGQLVVLRVESDLTFDPTAVSFEPETADTPLVDYLQVCEVNDAATGYDCSTEPEKLAAVPVSTSHFGAFVALADATPRLPFVAPFSGLLQIHSPTPPGDPFVFAVRSDRQGIISVSDCRFTSCSTLDVDAFAVTAGESITLEIVRQGTSFAPSTLTVSYPASGETFDAPLTVRPFAQARQPTPFAGGYRRWHAGVWNENQPFAPAALLDDYQNLASQTLERQDEIARSAIPPQPSFGGDTASGGAPAWFGPASVAFVAANGLSAARIGLVFGDDHALADGGGVFAGNYVRLSGTRSFNLSADASVGDSLDYAGVSLHATKSTTTTTTDVLDVNGDGVADVVAGHQTWLGAFTDALLPGGLVLDSADALRKRQGHEYSVGFSGHAALLTTTGLGRPLNVDSNTNPSGGLFGFFGGTGRGIARNQTTDDLVDVNGDGLPDRVIRRGSAISVELNLGHRFASSEPFGTVADSLQEPIDAFQSAFEDTVAFPLISPLISLDSTSDALQHDTTVTRHSSKGVFLSVVDVGTSKVQTSTRTTKQLADLNGDGLPDLLVKKDGEAILVQYNRGGDFGPAVTWGTPSWTVDGTPVDLGASFDGTFFHTLGLTGPDVLAQSTSNSTSGWNVSASIPGLGSAGIGKTTDVDDYELGLVDIDGDGDADHVLRRGHTGDPSTFVVKRNVLSGQENLLHTVNRPLGGTVTLGYTRVGNTVDMPHSRQVLDFVEVDDQSDLGADFASPNLVTRVAYDGGFYDRDEKEFFGFSSVTTTRADDVTVEDRYNNATFAMHGRLLSETRRDGGGHLFHQHVITHEIHPVLGEGDSSLIVDPACLAQLHPLLGPDACVPVLPIVVQDDDTRAEGGIAQKTRTIRNTDFDRFGNVLASTDGVDDAIATDDTFASAQYQNDPPRWIIGRPTSLQVRAGSAGGALLRSRIGDYDALGELTAVHVDTGAGVATTQLAYDVFGNLSHVTTPPNEGGVSQTFDVTYDPDVATYPASMRDGFGYTSTAIYDVRFGVATSETDMNGAQLTRTFDAFGRLATVRGPYDTAAAALTMDYHPEEFPPRAVTTTRASAPPDYTGPVPAPITTVTIADGLGRAIELRKTSVVNGVPGMTTSGLIARDVVGRVIRTQQPFFTPVASTGFVTPQSTPATTMAYDSLDRPVLTRYPDAATESASFAIAAAPGGATLFLSRMIDPNGHARETFLDHGGRTRAFVEHPTAATSSVTSYDYLPTGELAHITDAEGNATSLVYDLRGLRTALANPDDGLIEDRYDLMGNRIALIEPNHRALGTQVHYLFERDRLVRIDYPQKPDVTFTYGAPGAPSFAAGRITRVTDETGTQDHSYGALGEVRRTIRTVVPAQQGSQSLVFDLHLTGDSLGRQLRIGYPDGEVVTNTYDDGGMLAQVSGVGSGWSRTYASELRYDVFGNKIHARAGNGAVTTWTFEPERVRLQSLTTTLVGSSGMKIQDLHYSYDAASNPVQIDNALSHLTGGSGNQPGPSSVTFTYDGVDRLMRSVGQGDLTHQKTTSYDQQFTYSASHNLLHKQRVHTITQNGGSVSTPDATNFASDYSYGGRPHLPTQIGDLQLTYDPSGNPTVRRKLGTGSQQNLVWDDDGRLVDYTSGSVHQTSTYDASGTRVRRKSTQSETVFSSPYFDLENGTQGVRHVFAGGARVASVLAKITSLGPDPAPPPANKKGTPYFFHSDHLGSTSVLTDESGGVQESLEYFSDGETWIDRGPQKPINGYLFSGKPFDPDTGFYDFGQRFYDPRTSLWLGNDPVFSSTASRSIGTPAFLSPLLYGRGSPLRFRDPFGLEPDDSQSGTPPKAKGHLNIIYRDFVTSPKYANTVALVKSAISNMPTGMLAKFIAQYGVILNKPRQVTGTKEIKDPRSIQFLLIDTWDKKSAQEASKTSPLVPDIVDDMVIHDMTKLGGSKAGQPDVVIAIDRVDADIRDSPYETPSRADTVSRMVMRYIDNLVNHEAGHTVGILHKTQGIMRADSPEISTFDEPVPDFGRESENDVQYWINHRFP